MNRRLLVDRWRRLLPGLWAGGLLCVALLATPAPFAVLASADAGRVVARIFVQEAWTSLALAVLLLGIERGRARTRAVAGEGSVLSTEVLLLLAVVFFTLAGYFGVRPLMPAARTGQSWLTFGQLHLASTALYAAKTICVLALAWRATAAEARQAISS